MKLTKNQLRKLIKEELSSLTLAEDGEDELSRDWSQLPERPPSQEINQVIDNIIAGIEQSSREEWTKGDVIGLLQQISSFYTGG
jgi:hypothetical protein